MCTFPSLPLATDNPTTSAAPSTCVAHRASPFKLYLTRYEALLFDGGNVTSLLIVIGDNELYAPVINTHASELFIATPYPVPVKVENHKGVPLELYFMRKVVSVLTNGNSVETPCTSYARVY